MLRTTSSIIRLAAIAALVMGLVLTQKSAQAHGDVEVGDYVFVVGWINEPAYVGFPNGLDLRVEHHETGEPVVGLEDSLTVTVIMGDSERVLELRPQFGQEGAYTADILPTEVGEYTFLVEGEIDGEPIEFDMTSGPDTFSSIESTDEVAFPPAEEASAAGAPDVLSFIAMGLGLLGLILGGLALARKSS